ncbi:hypothetical protein HQN89_05690 [Paenibacillus frigoriresistens]|nr:hypothetical protein [Paenibacillus frigoriresistens]
MNLWQHTRSAFLSAEAFGIFSSWSTIERWEQMKDKQKAEEIAAPGADVEIDPKS